MAKQKIPIGRLQARRDEVVTFDIGGCDLGFRGRALKDVLHDPVAASLLLPLGKRRQKNGTKGFWK
jgi:hypothetical protein